MHGLDKLKFVWQRWKNKAKNQRFVSAHPELKLPPPYMLFEAFQLDYEKYFEDGKNTAGWLIRLLQPHTAFDGKNILDWGCGPARVLRHLPSLLPQAGEIHGTDYNPETIAWCKESIPGVQFSLNQLDPPTVYPDSFFDLIYGISIFTHLSEANHAHWFDELMRISKSGAVLLLTTQGRVFRDNLTDEERARFDRDELVERGKVVEGHRVFAAFHPPAYVRKWFGAQAEVLQHIEGAQKEWGREQDVWILQKK